MFNVSTLNFRVWCLNNIIKFITIDFNGITVHFFFLLKYFESKSTVEPRRADKKSSWILFGKFHAAQPTPRHTNFQCTTLNIIENHH